MDNSFCDSERLYRAVYPPSQREMFWKKNGCLSSAAFADNKGLSVERGYFRDTSDVVNKMKQTFSGCIVSVSVKDCHDVDAVVKYMPSKSNIYHSEIHCSDSGILLTRQQRLHLASVAKKEYMEE